MQVIVSHYTNVLTREFNTFISDTAIRQVNNATYSSESQNVYCNENLDLKSDNEGIRTVYSVGKRIPNAQYENVLEYVCNDDYDHKNFPEKTETANSSVYSHLAGNAGVVESDGSAYYVTSHGSTVLDNSAENCYDRARMTTSITDVKHDTGAQD
jgi:hypothetical protein